MNPKNIILTTLLALALIVTVAPATTHADQLSDLQAKVQALTTQINALKAARNIPATTTGNGVGYCNGVAFTRNLTIGSVGDDVKCLQQIVGNKITGTFGPKTLTNLKKFQKSHGIADSGNIGQKTKDALSKDVLTTGASKIVIDSGKKTPTLTDAGVNVDSRTNKIVFDGQKHTAQIEALIGASQAGDPPPVVPPVVIPGTVGDVTYYLKQAGGKPEVLVKDPPPSQVGIYTVEASFIPDDKTLYNSVPAGTSMRDTSGYLQYMEIVAKHDLKLVIRNNDWVFNGQKTPAFVEAYDANNGMAFVPGTVGDIVYREEDAHQADYSDIPPSKIGVYRVLASFTPNDPVEYPSLPKGTATMDLYEIIAPPPTIKDIVSNNVFDGDTGTVPFTLTDPNLIVTASVSNIVGNPIPSISVTLGGTGVNRTAIVTKGSGQYGKADINLFTSDGVNTRTAKFTVIFTSPELPVISMSDPWVTAKQSADVYVGDMAQFTSTKGDTSYTYSCGTGGSLVTNPLNPTGLTLGTFYCKYTSAGSKVVSISQNGNVLVSKTINVLSITGGGGAPSVVAGCSANPNLVAIGQPVVWSATATGGTGTGYIYDWGGYYYGVAKGPSNTLTDTKVTATEGTHTEPLTVTDSLGHTATTFCSVTVSPPQQQPLTASCSATPDPVAIGQPVVWSATATGGTGTGYIYDWGGYYGGVAKGSSNTLTDIQVAATEGTHTEPLTVTDSGGNTADTVCSVTVSTSSDVFKSRDQLLASLSSAIQKLMQQIQQILKK